MKIGSKVICVDDANWSKDDFLHFHSLPVRGHVYVVRSVFTDAPDPFCPSPLALEGIEGEMIYVMDFFKKMVYMEAHFCGKRFEEILTPVNIPELDKTYATVNRNVTTLSNNLPENDLQEWEYNYVLSPPPCPFCNDGTAQCVHVLLNIDKNANVCLSGYLYDLKVTEKIKIDISALIQEDYTPVISSKPLLDLWQTAVDSFDPVNGIMNWDYVSYFEMLDERFKEMGILAFRYWSWGKEDVFDIYFAVKPEETVETFHQYIIGELKMH